MTIKIGITGNMRSGKDTVAELIEKEIHTRHSTPQAVQIMGFVDGIKQLIGDYVPDIYNEGKPRKALQEIGQLMRSFDGDVWVNKAMDKLEALPEDTSVIFKDVRQPNEVQALKDRGFTIIKVESPERTRIARAKEVNDNFKPEQLLHETELAVDRIKPDYCIENKGSLQDLEHTTRRFLRKYYNL